MQTGSHATRIFSSLSSMAQTRFCGDISWVGWSPAGVACIDGQRGKKEISCFVAVTSRSDLS